MALIQREMSTSRKTDNSLYNSLHSVPVYILVTDNSLHSVPVYILVSDNSLHSVPVDILVSVNSL